MMNNNFDTFFTGNISCLQEVDENEDNPDGSSPTSYHAKVLTYLFGKEVADSFLHPVIETSGGFTGVTASIRAGKKIKSMSKKRLNLTYEQTLAKLSSNAERLWMMLRESSNYSIELEDRKIGSDLKSSFDAFARSYLVGGTGPERNFSNNSELTEMSALLSKGRVEKANLARRKKQLMYSLSRVQQHNQALLMRDKSFLGSNDPDTSLKELLFPPIVHSEAEEKPHCLGDEENQNGPKRKDKSIEGPVSDVDEQDRPDNSLPRLVFFSEADSQEILKEKCEFRKHMSEKLGQHKNIFEDKFKDKPVKSNDEIGRRRDAASFKFIMTPLNSMKTTISDISYETSTEKKERIKAEPDSKPLTLGAVMDFKVTKKPTFINEDEFHFRQGSVRLWRQKLTQA